jgi:hypothetical protein
MLDQDGDIFHSVAETGYTNLDRAEAVEEIFAETSGKDFSAKITILRGNQADVHALYFRRADSLNLAVLNHAKQFCLHLQRGLTDSRNTAPLLAYSKRPGRVSVAPVNAPRT